ncbi:MAG: sigma-54-dependent transcriptional regulator [bacterium]
MAEILIIDDEERMLTGCVDILKGLGHRPVPIGSAVQAIRCLETQEFDLILCDLFMPDMDGLEFLEQVHQLVPFTPVIILTAYGSIDRAVAAMRSGAFDFIEKPFEIEHLKIALGKGLRQRELFRERKHLLQQLEDKYSFDRIIGRSAAMQKVFDMISSVAPTDANVVITGDSGTGKELVARSIHAHSRRSARPFMPVNCGALPEPLFESEIFGYEKGAFTGATGRRAGLLELANSGTFFLDEVCELSEALQVKLLRVLQDGQIRRLSGDELIGVDVRFIAASNQDLESAVKLGRLREDFFYRLNVVSIHLPPLRQRREDIRLLAEHFLQRLLKATPKKIVGFHEEVLHCLENYDWPGNVRELENTVERAVALTKTEEINLSALPPLMRHDRDKPWPGTGLSLVEAKNQAVEEVERTYLLSLLKKHHGHVTHMAAEAGMTRRSLHRLLARHGLSADAWRRPQ